MEQILLAYSLPKETVAVITILYRNTKVKVRLLDGDTEYFDIVAGVLQGDTLALYLFIICLEYVLRTSIDKIKENGFELIKKRSRRYPTKAITDADYADDIAILANTPNQAETLLHRMEKAAAGIGLHVNAHKTEYMCFNQTGDISTLDGSSPKLVDKFTYLGNSVSSTEKDIDTQLTKSRTAFDKLSIIWKSDLTDKMKRNFFPSRGCIDTAIWMHYLNANKTTGDKAIRQLHKNVASNIEQVLEATLHKAPTIWPHTSQHENYPSSTNQTCRTQLEKQGRAHKRWIPRDPHIWPRKSRTTSVNIHTVALWGYGMKTWRPARGD